MEEKLVSIITPTYNCGKYISQTIESILKQTYRNWEMIIVDDCSSDDTKEIVEKYKCKDKRINYYLLAQNSGPAIARNKAMEIAAGSYMAFCDSDDIWVYDKLEKQINWMEKNNIYFSCTYYDQVGEDGNSLDRVIKAPRRISYNRQLLDAPIGNSTVVYSVEKMGKFEVPNIRKRNDDALWFRMYKKEMYCYALPCVLMHYRIRKGSVSSNKVQLIKYHWKLYREIEHLGVLRSAFHCCFWVFLKLFHIK